MRVDVLPLPTGLSSDAIGAQVVVFDVLRATTSMVAALASGVREIRVFGDIESAREAAAKHGGPRLLCGEVKCLRPESFDLGNSPGDFTAAHAQATAFMSTTNGTKAIVAAQLASTVLIGALVNAGAVAKHLLRLGGDVTLLCAGTAGRIAMEDLIGAGAVLDHLQSAAQVELASDIARIALWLFQHHRGELVATLSTTQGGRNVTGAGLQADLAFAARLDTLNVVGVVKGDPLRVVRLED